MGYFITFAIFAYVLQAWSGLKQMKNFGNEYTRMRRVGKVAIGRSSPKIGRGSIVLLGLNDNGVIREALKMHGLSTFARFKPMPEVEGMHIEALLDKRGDLCKTLPKSIMKSLDDALATYNYVIHGIPLEEKTLFKKRRKEIYNE